jgi:hypothetical protein
MYFFSLSFSPELKGAASGSSYRRNDSELSRGKSRDTKRRLQPAAFERERERERKLTT